MDIVALRAELERTALDLGFHRVAYVAAGESRDLPHLDRWLDAGHHADMEWIRRSREKRADVRRLLPGARTVVALMTFYDTRPEGDAADWVGRVSRYAWGRDYHNVLGRRLRKLVKRLEELAPDARTVTAVDFRPILEKEWAERAGLGWIGKHSNLITRDRGSFFFLSELVTELDLAPGAEPEPPEHCGTCTRCLDDCPTGAIVAPYQVDARRCISWLTIENRGAIPREVRPQVGEWIFGCDVCQDVCPWNRFSVPVEDPAFSVDTGRFHGDLEGLLELDEPEFLRRYEGSPVRRAGRDGFLRNVCVALGNRARGESVPALTRALNDESALVRAHAAWALGRIPVAQARAALWIARDVETEEDVRAELDAALA